MRRRDWLLVSIGSYIEPIQIQKTLFKFAQESDAPPDEKYEFRAYNWGPHAVAIYSDLENLIDEHLIEAIPTTGGWRAYRLTPDGEAVVAGIRSSGDKRLVAQLDEKRQ